MGLLSKTFVLLAVLTMAMSMLLGAESASCVSNVLPPDFTAVPYPDFEFPYVTLTITNPKIDGSSRVFYDVRYKSTLDSEWIEMYPDITMSKMSDKEGTYSDYIVALCQPQSDGNYTMIDIQGATVTSGGQLYVQVQTLIGHNAPYYVDTYRPPAPHRPGDIEEWSGTILDARSDWSPTLTVNIPTPSPPPTPTPSPTPTPRPVSVFGLNIEQIAIVFLAVVVACLAVGMVLLWRKVIGQTVRV